MEKQNEETKQYNKDKEMKEYNKDKSNKQVLITGANQGIGLHTALALADKGGHDITLACRSRERAEEAVERIRARNREIRVDWMPVDLADLDSVRNMLEQISREQRLFDVLILNAGVLLPKEARTKDGHESSFQVNFLAHFLLAEGIVAHQCPERPLKVVTLTSVLAKLCGVVFPVEKDPARWPRMFDGARRWRAYALSKFATALLARHLNGRQGVRAVAVHPGAVRTQMAQGVGTARTRKFLFFFKHMLIEPEVAAANVVFCVDNELGPNEFRDAQRVHKLPPAVCKQRNADALVGMARDMVAAFRPRARTALAARRQSPANAA